MLVPEVNIDAYAFLFNESISRTIGGRKIVFQGERPLVIVTRQGITPASRNDQFALAGGFGQIQVGGHDAQVAVLDAPPKIGGEPERAYEINHIVIGLDISGSMSHPIFGYGKGGPKKLEHIKDLVKGLAEAGFPKHAKVTLLVFNHEAKVATTSDKDLFEYRTDLKTLLKTIEDQEPAGDTDILKIFELTCEKVNEHNDFPQRPGRTLFLFLTDGEESCHNPPATTYTQARNLRDLNVCSFTVGIGSDYKQQFLYGLTSNLGYSGMTHTPKTDASIVQGNIFTGFMPRVIRDLKSSDFYINVLAQGLVPDEKLFPMAPGIRAAEFIPTSTPFLKGPHYKVHSGYTRTNFSVGFAPLTSNVDDFTLLLQLRTHAGGKVEYQREIPVHPIHEAASLFEDAISARNAYEEVMLFLAGLEGDMQAFNEAASIGTGSLTDDAIRKARSNLTGDKSNPNSRMASNETISDFGTNFAGTISDFHPGNYVNDLSRVDASIPPGFAGGSAVNNLSNIDPNSGSLPGSSGNQVNDFSRVDRGSGSIPDLGTNQSFGGGPHSGVLANINQPPGSHTLPPIRGPEDIDPEAYGKPELPIGFQLIHVCGPGNISETKFDLQKKPQHKFGSQVADCIITGESQVEKIHFTIIQQGRRVMIYNSSQKETYVNDRKISSRQELKFNDRITVGTTTFQIKFTYESDEKPK